MAEFEELDKAQLMTAILKAQGVHITPCTSEQKEKATQILNRVMREIKRDIPELVAAINLFKLYPVDIPINISTDFTHMFFNPVSIIKLSKKNKETEIKFQIMHVVLHGLMGDAGSIERERQQKVLWLAQDQRVDDICEKLGVKSDNEDLHFYLKKMRENKPYSSCFGNTTLSKKNKYVKKKAKAAQKLIASDEHFFWSPIYVKKILGDEVSDELKDCGPIDVASKWEQVTKNVMNETGMQQRDGGLKPKEIDKMTNKLNKNKTRGTGAGNNVFEINEAQGEPLDYKQVLKKLLRQLEDPREIPDSIDPNYYQFGLDTYGNIPLIEPKEGDEVLKLNTLCVAIDTSGSCSGEIAEKFLREIKGLLNDSTEMVHGGEIILFQCDDEIQDEKRIQVSEWIDEDELKLSIFYGFGGTSFVPVFEKIDKIQDEEKIKIDGLVYLSDGYGLFPPEEPSYPTIFVLPEQTFPGYIPEWVQTGVLTD